MDENTNNDAEENAEPEWAPLSRVQRRVIGVLVEKSKTTPDIYPMTVNAIKTGANQKSNRSPKMELEPGDVQESLDELRALGAVIEVMGDGRMPKFKHRLYDWLLVDRAELAVLAELLLRGEQSMGDLRARAARMEKIAGLSELRPIVDSLIEKNLMVSLTPPGRGQVITHNLYLPNEMERLVSNFSGHSGGETLPTTRSQKSTPKQDAGFNKFDVLMERFAAMETRVSELEKQVTELRENISD